MKRDEKTEAASADASSSSVIQRKSLLMLMIMNETLSSYGRKRDFSICPQLLLDFERNIPRQCVDEATPPVLMSHLITLCVDGYVAAKRISRR